MNQAFQWQETELVFEGPSTDNPYVDVEAWVDFVHDSGEAIRRPVFWDGDRTYRVRVAPTKATVTWRWTAGTASAEHRVQPGAGQLEAAGADTESAHEGLRHGFAQVAPGARAATYADGTPAFLVADT